MAPIVGSGVEGDLLHEGKLDLPELRELSTPHDLAWARETPSRRKPIDFWTELLEVPLTHPPRYPCDRPLQGAARAPIAPIT
jgi:hypothetical protein